MKTFIKTAAVFVLGLFMVLPQSVFAAASFNTDPGDRATLRAVNSTVNGSCGNACWATSINASAGDNISFAVYYHNTSSETARNVRVTFSPQSTGTGNTQAFTATVRADNASTVTGSATVSISGGAQSMSFVPGTGAWYPNQSSTKQALPSGQNGSEIFSSGVSLGDIAPGWSTQGSVVLGFKVSTTNNGGGNTLIAITRSADSITDYSARFNGSLTTDTSNTMRWFEWGTTSSLGNETTHQVQYSSGDFSQSVYTLSPNTTYYVRAVAQNTAGTIARGSILSFTTTGGSQNNLPSVTTYSTTYIADNSATIRGYVNPNGTSDTTRWFEWGSSSSLGNVTVHISQGSSAGEFTTTLTGLASNSTYYYRAVAQNSAGTVYGSIMNFMTTGGSSNSLPSVTTYSTSDIGESFAVLQGYVNPNGTSDTTRWFEWGTGTGLGNTTTKLAQGSGAGNFTATISGLANNQTYYYRAVAQNSQGTVYGSILSFTTQTGSSSQLPFVTTSPATGVTENYATLNGYVNPNNTYNNSYNTQYWFEWGTNTNLGNSTSRTYLGSIATNVSTTISGLAANTNYYYRVVAQNSAGTVYGSVLSFNTNGGYYTPQGGVPTAITTLATNVTQSSAKLNGLALISGNVSTTGWFEWGTNTGLGNRTGALFVGSAPSLAFSDTITGLSTNQIYYYRAVAENNYGTSRGSILSFTTTGGQIYYPPVVVQQPPTVIVRTVVGKGVTSPIELSILGGNETVIRGETINYTVHYEHKGTVVLSDVVLRVVLPKEMQYIGASRGSFSDKENTLTVDIGTLSPGNSGDVTVSVRVLPETAIGKLLVVTAVLVYTDTSTNTQGDAIAYAIHTVVDGRSNINLGAFAGGGFFPDNAFGWLLLLVLVFILAALIVFMQGSRRRMEEARRRTDIH